MSTGHNTFWPDTRTETNTGHHRPEGQQYENPHELVNFLPQTDLMSTLTSFTIVNFCYVTTLSGP